MGAPSPIPQDQPQAGATGFHPPTHGNWAQWAAVAIAILGNIGLTLWFHYTEHETKSADEHINSLIDAKLNPALRDLNDGIDRKLEAINRKLDSLTDKVDDAEGQLKRLEGKQPLRQNKTVTASEREQTIDTVASIKEEIQRAAANKRVLPASQLANYRSTLHTLPPSASGYWPTLAAIVNYQSLINQLSGKAPDPAKVSHPCPGLTSGTGGNNISVGEVFENCIVDLDTTHNLLVNATFKDSVIRYHGGPVALNNVAFVNCYFMLDLSERPEPANEQFLLALLDSPNQTFVRVSTQS